MPFPVTGIPKPLPRDSMNPYHEREVVGGDCVINLALSAVDCNTAYHDYHLPPNPHTPIFGTCRRPIDSPRVQLRRARNKFSELH